MRKHLIFLLIIFSSQVLAEKSNPSFYGMGGQSCGSYVYAMQSSESIPTTEFLHKLEFLAWIGGYLSAFNALSPNMDIGSDLHGPTEWINLYCKNNPMKSVYQATEEFIRFWMLEKVNNLTNFQ